jgi:drug/metabolite transporter (DMT)-like permease
MRAYDLSRLLALGAVWGIAFFFMRVAAPALGTSLTAELRALSATIFLLAVCALVHQRMALAANWRTYAFVGLINNALPFLCFAFAALHLPAGYLAILNGTSSLFTAVISAAVLRERLTRGKIAGFVLGLIGIALIVQLGPIAMDGWKLTAILVALVGSALWGWGSILIKQRAARLPLMGFAAGTTLAAAIYLAPSWLTAPSANWTLNAAAAGVTLGLLCTGVAYLWFFSLLRDVGASKTMAVTFLVPAFGVFWGWLLLGEPVTLGMCVGIAVVFAALALVFDLVPGFGKTRR